MLSRQFCKFISSNRTTISLNYYRHRSLIRPQCPCKNTLPSRTNKSAYKYVTATPSAITCKRLYSAEAQQAAMKPSKNEQLLEKLISGLSSDIHQKNRVYKNDFEKVLSKVKELNFSTKKQSLLLIQCCSDLMPDEPAASRMTMVEDVWKVLKPHTKFDVDHYNKLLEVYIANNRTATVSLFLQQMEPVKPNLTTYELFIKLLAEAGDLNQATEVIANMKAKGLPASESIFNSLIICQGKAGNLKQIDEILLMMKSLKIEQSADTYVAIIRSLIWNKKSQEMTRELEKAKRNGVKLEEKHIMDIVKTLAIMNMDGIVTQVLKFLPEETLNTPSISPYMQSVATSLVFQNHPVVALEIYKCLPLPSFGPMDDKGLHGRSLVRDCVKASTPSSVIGYITQQLMSSGRNPIAIQNACEAALQQSKVPLALDLFLRMQQLGLPIRPHYFWPILLHSSRSYGEKGIMNTLTTMAKMDVKLDYETLMEYTMPFVSFTSPQNLMKKFQDTGLSITTVLTPMMETLLNTGQVRAASEICEIFNGKVDVERILKPLLKGYLTSGDLTSTIHILEDSSKKAVDCTKDWLGRFLCVFMKDKKAQHNLKEIIAVLKELKTRKMQISTSAADFMMSRIPETVDKNTYEEFHQLLVDLTDEKMVDEGDMFTQQVPHPKNMSEEALRSHLTELEAKGMNTRGVLRKLLQLYCRNNNLKAAQEIVKKCNNEGMFLSAGMKAAIFDLHVKLGELELAEIALADLNKSAPNFTLDEHKIVDFATLMVVNNSVEKAFQLIDDQSKKRRITGGRGISVNCWRLLNACASHCGPAATKQMFHLLMNYGYCGQAAGNALMGPLVKAHLNANDLHGAVEEYNRLSKKYNKTPLKHELLVAILKTMGDGGDEDNFIITERSEGPMARLAQNILEVDKRVHGAGNVQLTLISALADVGYKKTLRKIFLDPSVKFHPDALLRRCERFSEEGNVKALEVILECAKDLRRIDVQDVCDLILDVHQRCNRTTEALKLWDKMQEYEINPSPKFVKLMCSFLEIQKKPVPPELKGLLGKQANAV